MIHELIHFSDLDENFPDPTPDVLEEMISSEKCKKIKNDFCKTFQEVWEKHYPNKTNKDPQSEDACYS